MEYCTEKAYNYVKKQKQAPWIPQWNLPGTSATFSPSPASRCSTARVWPGTPIPDLPYPCCVTYGHVLASLGLSLLTCKMEIPSLQGCYEE